MEPEIVIYERPGDYAAIPWLVRLKGGRLLLAFRLGTMHQIEREGRVVVCSSDDSGKTWTLPQTIVDHAGYDDREPSLIEDTKGVIWMSCMGQNEERDLYTTWLLRSFDKGETWTAPQEFPWKECGFMLRHPFLDAGVLRWAGHIGRIGARAVITLEEGPAGWESDVSSMVAMGWGNEWMACDTPKGPYAILREAQTMPGFVDRFYGRRLYAGGTPKARLWHTKVPSRPFLLWLDNKQILACALDQRGARRIVLVPSYDCGETWREDRTLVVLEDSDALRGTDFGYGSLAQTGADEVFVVYWGYSSLGDQERAIYGSRMNIGSW